MTTKPKQPLPVVSDRPRAKPRAGGWSAFTDGGAAPGWVTAARVVLVIAFAATIPTLLNVEHGNRIFWTIGIAAVPALWVVAGFHLWRRICPLAVMGQVGRLFGRPGTRKAGDWLARNYLVVQLALMIVALSLRLIATNGSPLWLAGFLGAIALAAVVTSFVYAGKTWCNLICPIGLVEKLYTEPARAASGGADMTSQCTPCVACKKHCPDIDQEQGYWKELADAPRRLAYFSWPGIVVGFYVYYWLQAGDWGWYFSGAWAYATEQPAHWLDDGFHFLPGVPVVVAAPLTLIAFGAASLAVFAAAEAIFVKRSLRGVADDDPRRADLVKTVRHRALAIAGFTAFNAFYFFAGQPSLQRLPDWVVHGWGAVVVFASAAIFFRRFRRDEDQYVHERFAQKILKKWEWGDEPPSDDLRDIYLLHTERTKQREARLRAYKETVRELVADGLVTRSELVILDSLRAQLGITDKDHQKILGELTEEERQMFDPHYQGSVEQRLQRQQYRRDLERALMDAARAGEPAPQGTIEALRDEYDVGDDEHAEELRRILAPDGPVAKLFHEEVAAIERLGAAAAATHAHGKSGGTESASLGLVHHFAASRARTHLLRALGLLGAITRRAEPIASRQAIALKKSLVLEPVAALVAVVPGDLLVPLVHAVELFTSGKQHPLTREPILAIADDASPYMRAGVALILSRFDDDHSRNRLIAALDDPEPIVREAAIRALGSRARLTRDLLSKALADSQARVRQAAVRAVAGTASSSELPSVDYARLAQTTRGVGNPAGAYATLDANAVIASLTTIERMMLLRQVPMFAGLDPDDLEQLADRVEEKRYEPNADLCVEGDIGDAVFLLVKGNVRVFTGGTDTPVNVLSELGQGACIGEMAVFDNAPRSATVRAIDRVRALIVPGERFKQLLVERPEMNQAIIGELVRRMRGMMGKPSAPVAPSKPDPATTLPVR